MTERTKRRRMSRRKRTRMKRRRSRRTRRRNRRRRTRRRRRRRKRKENVISNEIRATVVDHVLNHGLSMREAGQRDRKSVV